MSGKNLSLISVWVVLVALSGMAQAADGTWNVDASGNWTNANNWTPIVPNAVDDVADFLEVITTPRTVTADAPVTAGYINFDNVNKYTVIGPNVITLDTSGGNASIHLINGPNHEIAAPVFMEKTTDVTVTPSTSTLIISGSIGGVPGIIKHGPGTLLLSAVNTYSGNTTVLGGMIDVTGSLANNGSQNVFVQTVPDFSISIRRAVGIGNSYAGLGSTALGGLNTTADILAGSNTGGNDGAVKMAWRLRNANESYPTQTSPPCPLGSCGLVSDVIDLSGMVNSGGVQGQADPFVLRMSYDPSLLVPGGAAAEVSLASGGSVYLAWLNPDGGGTGIALWENAVSGNYGGPEWFAGIGDWSDYGSPGLGDDLGRWGVNPATHTVWAVLNHDSQFAVVPEPATLSLLALGGLAMMRRKQK